MPENGGDTSLACGVRRIKQGSDYEFDAGAAEGRSRAFQYRSFTAGAQWRLGGSVSPSFQWGDRC